MSEIILKGTLKLNKKNTQKLSMKLLKLNVEQLNLEYFEKQKFLHNTHLMENPSSKTSSLDVNKGADQPVHPQ